MSKLTLEQLLNRTPDKYLKTMYYEVITDVISTNSEVHEFVSRINRLIDKGELCINTNNYRHIYTPTVIRAIYKELARRYMILDLDSDSYWDTLNLYTEAEYNRILEGGEQ